ncbi:immunity 40 family protein [Salegentibacter mishustinae]|jgi:hypothetical protein|uniref:Imm40 family immunity protein n=1 Tax=Salegentibacter mishustinae TaxID=270918 RepID=UPI001CE060E0|nr:Imm40 family immunity protein [Salegentibacter mishustinae]UBZ06763.1 immunity 40 family protein [Salegentibacter mishustinae]
METIFSNRIDKLLISGIFVQEHKNWLFKKRDALNIIEILIENNYPILGGEIYDKKFSLIWSWSCNKLSDDNGIDFLYKSKENALENIHNSGVFQDAAYYSFTPTLL